MTRFIWRNWWRHKQRFILLLVGILIISSGLTFLSTLTESNFGTVSNTLEKKWRASYDIVVRSQGTRSVTEEDKLFEPNFLSGIGGGISTEQYKTIKGIDNVDIAAPLAVMGYVYNDIIFEGLKLPENGIYRISNQTTSRSGIHEETEQREGYTTKGFALNIDSKDAFVKRDFLENYGLGYFSGDIYVKDERLLVGVDPEQEAKLVGLDEAILPFDSSRYFQVKDNPLIKSNSNGDGVTLPVFTLPVLVSSQPFVDKTSSFRIEKLDLPAETNEQMLKTMEMVKEKGGVDYLKTVGVLKENAIIREYDTKQLYEVFFGMLTGLNPYTGDSFETGDSVKLDAGHDLFLQPTPLQINTIMSPYPDRWTNAYQVTPTSSTNPPEFFPGFTLYRPYTNSFRDYNIYQTEDRYTAGFRTLFNIVGVYDPGKLRLSKDPMSETPLETYRSPAAKLVLDAQGNPVNPAQNVAATTNPLGVLTSAPTILTTIDGATAVLGDKAISSIRVKVAGVTDFSAENQAKVERVAAEIERQTGLLADIILGSSPEPVLINIPANGDVPALGWIEQMWMKVGVTTGIFQETQMGFSIIMLLILIVAVLYVQATQLVSLFMRRKEFAVLLAVGWKPSQLKRMIVQEAVILGLFAFIVSGIIGFMMKLNNPQNVDLLRIGLISSLGLVVYLLGSLWPAWLSGRIKPYETMRTGEITKQSRRWLRANGMFAMALNHFLGKLGRYSLSIVSIALPTALLVLLLFITLRLKGVLYTSWVGQYISVQIGPQHYIAIVVTLVICVLTTGELVWQNVTERKVELFLLKSIGWRSGAVRRLIILEGWICGLLSGIIGYGIGLIIVWYMYASVPWLDALYLLPVCAIPMIIGLISAWIPAEFAVRGFPAGTTRTIYTSKKGTERWFFAFVTVLGLIVVVIAGKLAYDYLPGFLAANAKPKTTQTSLFDENAPQIGDLRKFEPQGVSNESNAIYDLSIEMQSSGEFDLTASIDVSNNSLDVWDKLVFYMIPNMFTKENKLERMLGSEGTFQINQVKVDGKPNEFTLHKDTLTVSLTDGLQQEKANKVEITYSFTFPEQGIRFTKAGIDYHLAQFYPMLANYQGGWNKNDYIGYGESYFTDFTDFKVHYKVPNGFTVVSSADDEVDEPSVSGVLEVKRSKEVFIGILKDSIMRKKMVGSTEIRVFGKQEDESLIDGWIDNAVEAFSYYEKNIGLYPRKQIDILIGPGANMEYPGIVTVGGFDDAFMLKQTLQHEMAHQWFYGVVTNDPYTEGYLDEGFTEFTASLLRLDAEQLDEKLSFKHVKEYESTIRSTRKPSNLPLHDYETGGRFFTYLYAQPTLKLWELFDKHDGIETARAYLKAYYTNYAYKQVDTKEFVRFTKAYFLMEDDKFFKSWLKYE